MNTNITLIGDWHGASSQARRAISAPFPTPAPAPAPGTRVFLHLGDFGIWSPHSAHTPAYLKAIQKSLLRVPRPPDSPPPNLFFIDGNHECADATTRAVTPTGFTLYTDLKSGDKVLSVSDDGSQSWQTIQEVIIKDYSGPLVYVSSRGLDMALTPGHRVVYQNQHNDTWREVLAKDLTPSLKKITRAATNPNPDAPLSDDMIRLYAWCITDGHHRANGGWHLYQRESTAYRIKDILTNLNIKFTTSTRIRNTTHIQGKELRSTPQPEVTIRIPVVEGRKLPWDKKTLWESVWSWSERQVDLFVEELVFCDGSWAKNYPNSSGVIYCTPPERIDSIRLLLTLNGWRTSLYNPRPGDFRLNISKHTTSYMSQTTSITQEEYQGKVWCVTVPNGRFFAERNGKIFLTGNCFPYLYSFPLTNSPFPNDPQPVRQMLPYAPNVYHLPRGSVHSFGTPLNFLAFGGAYSIDRGLRNPPPPENPNPKKNKPSFWYEEVPSPEEFQRALYATPRPNAPHSTIDIMLTHDTPLLPPHVTARRLAGRQRAYAFFGKEHVLKSDAFGPSLLAPLLAQHQPQYLFYGHNHERLYSRYEHPDTGKITELIGLDEGSAQPIQKHIQHMQIQSNGEIRFL